MSTMYLALKPIVKEKDNFRLDRFSVVEAKKNRVKNKLEIKLPENKGYLRLTEKKFMLIPKNVIGDIFNYLYLSNMEEKEVMMERLVKSINVNQKNRESGKKINVKTDVIINQVRKLQLQNVSEGLEFSENSFVVLYDLLMKTKSYTKDDLTEENKASLAQVIQYFIQKNKINLVAYLFKQLERVK